MPTAVSRGFTLLELIIVIVIVGITVGFIGPRLYTGISSSGMDEATREILAILQYARSTAVTRHMPYYVRFDIDGRRVGLFPRPQSSGETPEMLKEKELPPGVRLKSVKTPYQSEKLQGHLDILVTPEGVIEQGVIYLEGSLGKVYTLVVKPFSGMLEIHDRYVEIAYEIAYE
ncbi:MAG: GspH/FimT family protein [Desulfomonilia bacterium]|jgi:prepilin-type N-terminal cleavage/methylation domain-containing protein